MVTQNLVTLKSTSENDLTPEKALLAGITIGRIYKTVTIGVETNPSSRMIKDAVISGLLSVGATVWDAETAPTPAIALASKNSDCFVMIGAPNDYGIVSSIYIHNPDGSAFSDEQLRYLLRISGEDFEYPAYKAIGNIHHCDSVIEKYNRKLSKLFKEVNCPVLIDCGCGCTSLCAPQILASVGADVTTVNSQFDINYCPRPPGVSSSDVAGMSELISANIGSIGIALNGDGTRLALLDEGGRYVKQEEILALMLIYLKPTKIVVPMNTSAMIDDAFWGLIGEGVTSSAKPHAERKIIRTESTIEAITKAIKEEDAELGAMNDGTFIFPEISMCSDAIYAAVLLSKIAGENSIRNLLACFPKYITLNDVIHYTGNIELFGKRFKEKISELNFKEIYSLDGWRVDMDYGWFIVTSNKENTDYLEIRAESQDKAYAISMMELAKSIIYKCI